MRGGLDKGNAGRDVFCDTLTSPQLQADCMGQKFVKSQF